MQRKPSTSNWNKLPTWWVKEEFSGLKNFKAGRDTGNNVASLKCLLALCSDNVFKRDKPLIASTTYDYLESVAGVSRPMIKKALLKLEKERIIKIEPDELNLKTKIYVFKEFGEGWAKVPRLRIYNNLKHIPTRGKAPLSALKIYIVLLTFRNNGTRRTTIGHEKLREYTGLQATDIRTGLDILINHGFIHINQQEDRTGNIYELIGITEES